MVFTHDVEEALVAAVALVNSAEPPETLDRVGDLDRFYAEHGYTGRHDRTREELEHVRSVRPLLRRLLLADRDDAVQLVNAIFDEHRAVPRLVRHDGTDWHLHVDDPTWPLADRIVVETALAMVDVVRQAEHARLATCADAHCSGVALDLSRNRSRRFCSTTCGNRNAVAAYRARRS